MSEMGQQETGERAARDFHAAYSRAATLAFRFLRQPSRSTEVAKELRMRE
jgi:hypothetical protein